MQSRPIHVLKREIYSMRLMYIFDFCIEICIEIMQIQFMRVCT